MNARVILAAAALLGSAVLFVPQQARAHCDALDGPVITDARAALDRGEVTPVLKWVRPADEAEVRKAFADAVAVRTFGPTAQELADRYFFETLVRVHRAGEGAPYTGLRPAGGIAPPIARADKALAAGSVDDLAKAIGEHAAAGVRERFARAAAARQQAEGSVAAGREYVEAYVDYIHYVEGVVEAVHRESAHGNGTPHAH